MKTMIDAWVSNKTQHAPSRVVQIGPNTWKNYAIMKTNQAIYSNIMLSVIDKMP